jgi:hypothetical protein
VSDQQARPCDGHHVTARGFRFICIRPYHGGDHIYVDRNRRANGKSVAADRHVFVRSGTVQR